MAVYDRWHTNKPTLYLIATREPCRCREHKLFPGADHGQGDRWQVRWRDDDGKQCKENLPLKTGEDPAVHAEARDREIQGQLQADTYIDPAAGQITLEAYAKSWRSGLTLDPASLEVVDKHLAHIYDVEPGPRARRAPGKSTIGRRKLRALSKSPSAIQQWIKGLESKGLSPGYIRVIVGTLSAIFGAARDDGVVTANPVQARSVKPPKVQRRRVVPWTMAMVHLAAAELDTRQDSGAMAYLGACAGLREGEIFGFAEEDIEFLGKDRMIHIRRQVKRIGKELVFALPKGGKQRDVPLSDELALRLSAQIKRRPAVEVTLPWRRPDGPPHTARLLFLRPDGNPWYRQAFQYTWNKAREAAGAPADPGENGIHVLRHTAASAWLAGGVDIRTLAEWLGHSDPGFTLRTYTHLMPDASARGRTAMDAFIRGSSALNVPSARGEGS